MLFKQLPHPSIKSGRRPARPIAADSGGTQYSLVVTNNSSAQWDFYVYQQQPGTPSPGVFSLAWFALPMAPTTTATFSWDISYNFVWSRTGNLQPGVVFTASQNWAADLQTANQVTFTDASGALTFANLSAGGTQGSLTIVEDGTIPSNIASVGIGMSGYGTFAVQAQPNMSAIFTPTPEYWVAFGSQVQQGVVLETQVGDNAQIVFPANVYTMYATLGSNNLWTVSQTPS